jgi:hypothetical protein
VRLATHVFADDTGQIDSERFGINSSTSRIRPRGGRPLQFRKAIGGFLTGDTTIERIAQACLWFGLSVSRAGMRGAKRDWLRLKGANFCRARLCPLCNWRRSLKLRYQLGRVLNVVFSEDNSLRMLLLTLTEPNSS